MFRGSGGRDPYAFTKTIPNVPLRDFMKGRLSRQRTLFVGTINIDKLLVKMTSGRSISQLRINQRIGFLPRGVKVRMTCPRHSGARLHNLRRRIINRSENIGITNLLLIGEPRPYLVIINTSSGNRKHFMSTNHFTSLHGAFLTLGDGRIGQLRINDNKNCVDDLRGLLRLLELRLHFLVVTCQRALLYGHGGVRDAESFLFFCCRPVGSAVSLVMTPRGGATEVRFFKECFPGE